MVSLRTLVFAAATLLFVPLAHSPASAQDYLLRVIDTEVAPGESFALPIEGDWAENVSGFTVCLTFPPTPPIENFSMSVDNTLVGALEPDFIILTLDLPAGEAIYAVLFDASPPFDFDILPPVGFPLLITELTGTIPVGTPDQDIPFTFTDGIGSPPKNNIFVVDFGSVLVQTRFDGQLQVRTPPVPTAPFFVRGDVNMDAQIDLGDVIFHLNYTFAGGEQPDCLDAGDANNDGHSDVSDAIFLLDFLFALGPHPALPYPAPGPDPLATDPLDCETPLYWGEI
ncbi:MAG: hypothetical protein KDC38_07970 [Planctomycetes bacterium]|nr:hypothetical protein [Planctomycetota bacterium]